MHILFFVRFHCDKGIGKQYKYDDLNYMEASRRIELLYTELQQASINCYIRKQLLPLLWQGCIQKLLQEFMKRFVLFMCLWLQLPYSVWPYVHCQTRNLAEYQYQSQFVSHLCYRPMKNPMTLRAGGEYRNRTGVHGFAIRCVTTPPTRHLMWYSGLYQSGACGAR